MTCSPLDNAQTCQTLQGTSINRPRAGLSRRATSVGKASRHGRAWQVEGADKDLGVGPVCNKTKDYSGEAWWFKAAFLLACKGRVKGREAGGLGCRTLGFCQLLRMIHSLVTLRCLGRSRTPTRTVKRVYKRSMTAPL